MAGWSGVGPAPQARAAGGAPGRGVRRGEPLQLRLDGTCDAGGEGRGFLGGVRVLVDDPKLYNTPVAAARLRMNTTSWVCATRSGATEGSDGLPRAGRVRS